MGGSSVVRALLLALLLVASGCTLVSGWSDLQGGRKTGTGTGTEDAGEEPSDAGFDVMSVLDGAFGDGIACGIVSCPGSRICCVDSNVKTCTTEARCDGIALGCAQRSDCPAGQLCCLQATFRTSCSASCGGALPLCVVGSPGGCDVGETCKTEPSTGLDYCGR